MSNRINHSDYRMPWFVVFGWPKANSLSDWILIGPVFASKALINNGYLLRVTRVGIGEVATRKHVYSHCAKISWGNNCVLNHGRLSNWENWTAFDGQAPAPVTSAQW